MLCAPWCSQAQVMSEKEALARQAALPVMFFGTLEIAWVAPGDTASWGDGCRAKFFRKAKSRRQFVTSVQEVSVPCGCFL